MKYLIMFGVLAIFLMAVSAAAYDANTISSDSTVEVEQGADDNCGNFLVEMNAIFEVGILEIPAESYAYGTINRFIFVNDSEVASQNLIDEQKNTSLQISKFLLTFKRDWTRVMWKNYHSSHHTHNMITA
jgi:hypothetical protein